VNITTGLKSFHERGIMREVRKKAELDLRIIRSQELPSFARDKSTPNVTPKLPSNGDVLEVWITRRQSASGCNRLIEGSVQTSRFRIDQAWQGIQISVLELRKLSILHQESRQYVPFLGQFGENADIGGRAGGRSLQNRKVQFLEKDLA
jgi:hypothetical protein